MRFKKWPQLPGAGRTRAGHHHGSHTPTSPEAILLGKMAHHTKQIRRECIRDYLYSDSNYKTLIYLTIFFAGGFSQPMDAAQMFKAFFGNGNGAGMHHAFHHHFGIITSKAKVMMKSVMSSISVSEKGFEHLRCIHVLTETSSRWIWWGAGIRTIQVLTNIVARFLLGIR